MNADMTDPRTPDDPEAAFLADLDAIVSGWPAGDGSDLLATATHVRDLAVSDPRARLDPARQQEIWNRIAARQPAAPRLTGESAGRSGQQLRRRASSRSVAPTASPHRPWRHGGWVATAVAICVVALLVVPLARELGTGGPPTKLPAQTSGGAFGAGGGGAGAVLATQSPAPPLTPRDAGMLAPPSTVIATMPANRALEVRLSTADPRKLLFQLEQNGINYAWEDRRRTDPSGPSPYTGVAWTRGDTDLQGSIGGVEIQPVGDANEPLAGYLVFNQTEDALRRLNGIAQTPELMVTRTRIDRYEGVIILDNDRVITIVQVGNVLVIGNAWTGANDWMSSELDLQSFKWQSLKQATNAIAYLDSVVYSYFSNG